MNEVEERQTDEDEPTEPSDGDIQHLDADARLDWYINQLMDDEGNPNFS